LNLLTTLAGGPVAASASSEKAIEASVSNAARSDADRARDETSKPVAVLGFLGIEPGMRVLDLLSAGGYYSEILSRAVGPDGEVVAHTNDIHEKYHGEEIAARYRNDRLPNVARLISNPPDLKLGSSPVDRSADWHRARRLAPRNARR
jgi:predicted methyltransferase